MDLIEANLEKFVSFTKGCYIGQEVIARLDTYKKLQRKLKRLILENGPQQSPKGGKLYLNGDEVGWTTSNGWSYKLNKAIALCYLKINVLSSLLEYKNDGLSGQGVAQVVDLPF